jgi:hypothetical protein
VINLVEYIKESRALVAELEAEGLTTSDAQGCAEAELYKKHGLSEINIVRLNPIAWLEACELVEKESN